MSARRNGYFQRLFAALLGRGVSDVPLSDESAATLSARVATLEMDLQERDERIERMRAEYETLQLAKDRAETDATRAGVENLLKRLSGPLATLVGLTHMADTGDEIEMADMIQLVRDVEKSLARAGLERIGTVGDHDDFDSAAHQRMSGGSVQANTRVTVRLPGYRLGDKVLIKAMVSAEEKKNG